MKPQISILTVSRTAELLNRLIASLDSGFNGNPQDAEILVSWNGSDQDEQKIMPGRLPTKIAQRTPYHFAKNMNSLAKVASGDLLVFANDDLIADPGSINAAAERLTTKPEVGIVGARLRTSSNQLAHAGIHFTSYGSPYHQLEHFADANHPTNHQERVVPAVTGAFFSMRRQDFLALELAETFKACGEDVLMSLQTRNILGKQVLYCPAMSGIHDAESTRSKFEEQRGNEDDMLLLRTSWLNAMQRASKETIAVDLKAAQDEAEALREICLKLIDSAESAKTAELHASLESLRAEKLQLLAERSRQSAQQSLLSSENKRLASRVQQLENQLERLDDGTKPGNLQAFSKRF
jgi:hypothetical protein